MRLIHPFATTTTTEALFLPREKKKELTVSIPLTTNTALVAVVLDIIRLNLSMYCCRGGGCWLTMQQQQQQPTLQIKRINYSPRPFCSFTSSPPSVLRPPSAYNVDHPIRFHDDLYDLSLHKRKRERETKQYTSNEFYYTILLLLPVRSSYQCKCCTLPSPPLLRLLLVPPLRIS